jgi:membrane-associated phospholipid phosphatase
LGKPLVARVRQFVSNRLSTDTYIGLHLTVSFIVAAAAIWLSSALLDAVLDNATLVHWDVAVAAWIHARVTPTGITVSQRISEIGSPTSMGVLAVVGGVVLLVRRSRTLLIAWIAAFAGGGALERILKTLVHRTRPIFTPTPPVEQSLSFPSGHSMMCALGVSMLVYAVLMPRRFGDPWRSVLIGCAVSFILLVGISRVYLGAHYPSDVLGGYAAAAGWMAICVGVRGIVKHHRHRSSKRKKAGGVTTPSSTQHAFRADRKA